MTDYLALRTEENEDALLKLERRLAAALAGAVGRTQDAGELEPSAAAGDGQAAGAEGNGQAAGAAGIRSLLPAREQGAEEEGWDSPLRSPAGGGSRENRREGLPLLPAADMAALAAGETPSPWRDALEAAEGRCALLEQLERLERAAALPEAEARRSAARGRSVWEQGAGNRLNGPLSPLSAPDGVTAPAGLPEAAEGVALRSGPGARAQFPGGAADWAEQVDLAFRRDSRRYDGGFYLY